MRAGQERPASSQVTRPRTPSPSERQIGPICRAANRRHVDLNVAPNGGDARPATAQGDHGA
jgi:hypothetical protein